jgi:hypothetical protein
MPLPRLATPLPQRDSSSAISLRRGAVETIFVLLVLAPSALVEQTITLPGADAANDAMSQNTH